LRHIWFYILGIDLIKTISMFSLPVDYALTLMVEEPRKMNLRLADGIWVRIVDLQRALNARSFGEGSTTIGVVDRMLAHNTGVWQVSRDGVHHTSRYPDLTIDISDLASAYLGAFSFNDLARAGRAQELAPHGLDKADRVFGWPRRPWAFEFF
jgi:predicted acetyltransferase